MALIIAGERSGAGKTTITLALLSFLSQQGRRVQSFKVGPDYIDPMFHAAITGLPCRNLDPILTSEAYVQSCFVRHCQGAEYALVEGVMGLFDGVFVEQGTVGRPPVSPRPRVPASPCPPLPPASEGDFASTAHIARLLGLPVLLVIDCSHLSGSVAAIAHGYRSFDPRVQLAGVVLNRVGSDRHLELLKDALDSIKVPILGVLHRQDAIAIPDRHLGLVPTAELPNLSALFDRLAALAATSFDWERLYPLLQTSSPAPRATTRVSPTPIDIKIAIARDRAFNFYYPDNLDILEQLGATLIPWSPIADSTLPEGTQGLYLGGGFPEVFAQALADNDLARYSVRQAILAGMPTYAECGGLMYLCDRLVDFAGKEWPMAGILPTTAVMGKRLTLGYRRATILQDSWLFAAGEAVRGHEFHRSHLTSSAPQPLFELRTYLPRSQRSVEGWQIHQLHASYLHLHFGDYLAIPEKFLRSCLAFSKRVS